MYSLWKEVSGQIKKKAEDLNNTLQELNLNSNPSSAVPISVEDKNGRHNSNEGELDNGLKNSIQNKLSIISSKNMNSSEFTQLPQLPQLPELQYYNDKLLSGINNLKKIVGNIYKEKIHYHVDNTKQNKIYYLSKIVPWKKGDIMVSKIYRKKYEECFPLDIPNRNINHNVYHKILKLNLDKKKIMNTIILENYKFNWEKKKEQSKKIVIEDPNLSITKHDLVPLYMSEMNFWKSYFFNIDIIFNEIADMIYMNKKKIFSNDNNFSQVNFIPLEKKHSLRNSMNTFSEHLILFGEHKDQEKKTTPCLGERFRNDVTSLSLQNDFTMNKSNDKLNICENKIETNLRNFSSNIYSSKFTEANTEKGDTSATMHISCDHCNEHNDLNCRIHKGEEDNTEGHIHVFSGEKMDTIEKAEINGLPFYMDRDIYLSLNVTSNRFRNFSNEEEEQEEEEEEEQEEEQEEGGGPSKVSDKLYTSKRDELDDKHDCEISLVEEENAIKGDKTCRGDHTSRGNKIELGCHSSLGDYALQMEGQTHRSDAQVQRPIWTNGVYDILPSKNDGESGEIIPALSKMAYSENDKKEYTGELHGEKNLSPVNIRRSVVEKRDEANATEDVYSSCTYSKPILEKKEYVPNEDETKEELEGCNESDHLDISKDAIKEDQPHRLSNNYENKLKRISVSPKCADEYEKGKLKYELHEVKLKESTCDQLGGSLEEGIVVIRSDQQNTHIPKSMTNDPDYGNIHENATNYTFVLHQKGNFLSNEDKSNPHENGANDAEYSFPSCNITQSYSINEKTNEQKDESPMRHQSEEAVEYPPGGEKTKADKNSGMNKKGYDYNYADVGKKQEGIYESTVDNLIHIPPDGSKSGSSNLAKWVDINLGDVSFNEGAALAEDAAFADVVAFANDIEFDADSAKFNEEELEQFEKDLLNA
ncbi:BSD-domain protein, putative [Plasmodium ovale wallikeri]|uniref:BSD-domain protein, putative n=1 Tax=Plasmodium ovale wallikeri TaxID=864142 RepID=A0A1A8YQN8_PLAOA|nr:BSD-domain protein, putative [Plasmodium ovale wallikeri]SBT56467.1 BSD-domain protein, putative [Plasmodium ovale wallikeri]